MNNVKKTELVYEEKSSMRIDAYLSSVMENLTRSHIQRLIEENNITVNDKNIKANYKLKSGDSVCVTVPEPKDISVSAEDISLDIVYEDEDMLVVNKPQGMVVHPAAGNYEGTLVNALLHHCKDSLSGINGEKRPGILHRIDKDTSGLLLVAKNDYAHIHLAEQIKAHSLTREYKALVHGIVKSDSGTINAPIGRSDKDRKKMTITYKNSREAITHYQVIERYNGYTFVKLRLETGRTHQIRVHMSKNSHPVVGDKTYGKKKEQFNLNGQLLHAYKVGFIHPVSKKYMEFESDLPEYFKETIDKISKF